jgi:multidrug transporter EmrE-like cation transporter
MAYIYLALAFVMNSMANVLLKLAAMKGFSFSEVLKGRISSGEVYIGLAAVLFAANLAFYVLTLRSLPLSVAYPIMIGMTFLITSSVALALGERITPLHIIGFLLIMLGIIAIVYTSQSSHALNT